MNCVFCCVNYSFKSTLPGGTLHKNFFPCACAPSSTADDNPANTDDNSPSFQANMEREEVLSLLDTQRKLFNDVMDRMLKEMREERQEYQKGMTEVISSLEFSQQEIEQLKGKVNELQKEKKTYVSQINSLLKEKEDLKADMKILHDRMDFLDDQGRNNNLRFSGIPEGENENWEQSQHKVNSLLNDHLKIKPMIERAHRVGRPSQHRPRDVIVKFTRLTQRDTILRDRTKLKGTQVYINEDLCPGTIDAQKRQMDSYHQARREGKIAYFNRKTLIIKDRKSAPRQENDQSNNTAARMPRGAGETDTPATPQTPQPSSQELSSTPQTPTKGRGIGESLKHFRFQRSDTQVNETNTPTVEGAVGGKATASGRGKPKKGTANATRTSRRGPNHY